MKIPCYLLLGLGLYYNPFNCLFAFILPGMLALVHTCWATYEHHAGHHSNDHLTASVNREDWLFNYLTCNLGLHTAHHLRPNVHWSQLPEVHAEIRDKIPPEQMLPGFW